ncbi:MAG: M15 family metallopeptidase [Chitinophagaceae bacterium]|nr:M15 family metallopeptidase [Chitinophagaceae bacterium]
MTYKISNRFYIKEQVLLIFSTLLGLHTAAQNDGYTRPPVTDKWAEYQNQVKKDADKKMVELKSLIPGICYDLRYASLNNFMKRQMYPLNTQQTYLRAPAAKALRNVQEDLNEKGYGLKIFDAYRPFAVTVKFWELVKDERYVANPSKGSGHNRGIAVDLTIINTKTGKELNMGTGFDNFTDTAHHTFTGLPEEILQNRELVKGTMEKNGFRAYESEWWHYSIPDPAKFEILDIDFKKLKKVL